MKARILLLFLVTGIFSATIAQNTLELSFTAVDSATHVQLGSVKIMNRTRGVDTMLYWPDTVLRLYHVGIPESQAVFEEFLTLKAYPNPVKQYATITIEVPKDDRVNLTITDLLGRTLIHTERTLEEGRHAFRYTPGNGSLCFATAQWRTQTKSIKILQTGESTLRTASLKYISIVGDSDIMKKTKVPQSFYFVAGDELLFIGFADTLESAMVVIPVESQTYTFQFATNIPCPGTPTLEYEGHVYNTIQIFSQCWLKENLNVGTIISGSDEMSDNDTIEKYCYDNSPDSCVKYGGLYRWDEMMQYTSQPGVQGICPPGWHLPTDEEWKVLEGAVDSHYEIGHNTWDEYMFRGLDAGTNLKNTSGWVDSWEVKTYGYENGNGTNLFDFSGLPGGYRIYYSGTFDHVGSVGTWWSSSEDTYERAYIRDLVWWEPGVRRLTNGFKVNGHSVRCLKDN